MSRANFRNRIRNVSTFIGGVTACAAAAESGRHPSRAALTAIGIDPEIYDNAFKR